MEQNKDIVTTLNDIQDDLNQAIERYVNYNDLDGAARLFKMYAPIFKNLVNRCSNRELKRLICMLVESPLQDKEYKPKESTIEGQAFFIGDNLMQAKMLMIMGMEQIKQAEKEGIVNESTENKETV